MMRLNSKSWSIVALLALISNFSKLTEVWRSFDKNPDYGWSYNTQCCRKRAGTFCRWFLLYKGFEELSQDDKGTHERQSSGSSKWWQLSKGNKQINCVIFAFINFLMKMNRKNQKCIIWILPRSQSAWITRLIHTRWQEALPERTDRPGIGGTG